MFISIYSNFLYPYEFFHGFLNHFLCKIVLRIGGKCVAFRLKVIKL